MDQMRALSPTTASQPEIKHGLANDGILQINIDQLNSKNLITGFSVPDLPAQRQTAKISLDGGVYNFESLAMRLTRGKLMVTNKWDECVDSRCVNRCLG